MRTIQARRQAWGHPGQPILHLERRAFALPSAAGWAWGHPVTQFRTNFWLLVLLQYTRKAGLGSSWVANFCSESTGYSRLTILSCHRVDFSCTYGVSCHVLRRATAAPMVFLSPFELMDCAGVVWFLFLVPCLRGPGRGVSGFLAGLALVAVLISRSSFAQANLRFTCFTCKTGTAQIR